MESPFIERLFDLLESYGNNVDTMLPLVLSFLILVISIAFVGIVRRRILHRMLFLVLAGIFFFLSQDLSGFGSDYFGNLSAELIGAFLATIIFAGGVLATSWMFPFIASLIIVTIMLLTTNALMIQSDISLNLSTELLGAFMTVVLLDPEWIWFPRTAAEKYERQVAIRQRRAKRMIDGYHVTIIGKTKRELQEHIDLFRERGFEIHVTQREKERQYFVLELVVSPKELGAEAAYHPFADHNEVVQVNITGRAKYVSIVYQQMKEVLNCIPQRKQQTHRNWIQLDLQIKQPQQLMSAYLEQHMRELLTQWRQSDKPHLQQASPELEQWAYEMNFIGKGNQ